VSGEGDEKRRESEKGWRERESERETSRERRGCQGLFTPVSLGYPLSVLSLGYPLSVFNKNSTLRTESKAGVTVKECAKFEEEKEGGGGSGGAQNESCHKYGMKEALWSTL